MQSERSIIEELEANPRRFRATGGYERLLTLLRSGRAFDAVRRGLRVGSEVAGDLLWTIAELDDVSPFVFEAAQHVSSADKGTAAYAVEVVLRGANDVELIHATVWRLRRCDAAVCEHAARTLAGEGLTRILFILRASGDAWCEATDEIELGFVRKETIEQLVLDGSRDRQVVGVALATLAYERDRTFGTVLQSSPEAWIRDYAEWLLGGAPRTLGSRQKSIN